MPPSRNEAPFPRARGHVALAAGAGLGLLAVRPHGPTPPPRAEPLAYGAPRRKKEPLRPEGRGPSARQRPESSGGNAGGVPSPGPR
jgi:hypothetical protein